MSAERELSRQIPLLNYFAKMKGNSRTDLSFNIKDSTISSIGALLSITILGFIAMGCGYPMAIAPIGASCILVFGAHKGPLSQPRAIIGGHTLSTVVALIIWDVFGRDLFTIGLTLALVLILMGLTGTFHPPSAASAIVAVNTQAGWGFIIPIMICSIILVVISTLYNNLFEKRQYPQTWI